MNSYIVHKLVKETTRRAKNSLKCLPLESKTRMRWREDIFYFCILSLLYCLTVDYVHIKNIVLKKTLKT